MCTFIIFAFTNHLRPSLPSDLPPPSPSTGQHESDSEDEEDVIEDVGRQYFIYSILVHVAPRL